jgi:ABC-type cobalamin/Fe3+-siderophores transport system ATPase subunit
MTKSGRIVREKRSRERRSFFRRELVFYNNARVSMPTSLQPHPLLSRTHVFWTQTATPEHAPSTAPLVQAHSLRFRYGETWVLDGIDFDASAGEVVALFGPNGSGKSTLLRCLDGLLRPQEGAVSIGGTPIDAYSRRQLARRIAFLPQIHPPLHHITVGELVARGRSPHQRFSWALTQRDQMAVRWALAYLQLAHLENKAVQSLSGGEQQRAWIAMVLAQDAAVVLLDEPVTFLDLRHQWDLLAMFRNLAAEHDKLVISVFHDVNHGIAVSNRAYLLQDGRTVAVGTPEDVITRENLADVYEVQAHVCKCSKCSRSVVIPTAGRCGDPVACSAIERRNHEETS